MKRCPRCNKSVPDDAAVCPFCRRDIGVGGSGAQAKTKKCPFCAEDIQAAAFVCKHCGRDLKGGASQVQIVQPKKKTGCVTMGCVLMLGFLGFVWLMGTLSPSRQSARPATATATAPTTTVPSEPDEPCRVEAPAAARAAAQSWCQGGIFTKVNVSSDDSNFVVLLQFSKKGQRAWTNGRYTILNRFRGVTDEIAQTADMNVAFSLHDPRGQMVGGCIRKRSERESTCKGQ